MNRVKSHTMTLAFTLQADMNQIFQMRYFTFLQVKRLQKYQRSKLENDKNLQVQSALGALGSRQAELAIFFATSNFDLDHFCSS